MNIGFFQNLKYRFDNSLSKGPLSLIAWLALVIFFILLLSASFIYIGEIFSTSEEKISFWQAFHEGYYQLFSSGAIDWAAGSGFKWIMGILCLLGLVFVSIFIGLISSSIEAKIEILRRGRSIVLEKNHIVIYGWSTKIIQVIQELILANENIKNTKIVILADKDKIEMDAEITEKIKSFKTSKIITRSGSTIDLDDVNIVNPQESRSIIILPTDDSDSDINVIKTLMALINDPNKKDKKYNIVTEISDKSKVHIGQILGKDEISIVQTSEVISRIMVQTCLQPGLSEVYNDLFSFEGNEIYFKKFPELIGKTFGESIYHFEHAILIGLYRANKQLTLNPNASVLIDKNDRLLFIAEDDSKIHCKESKKELVNNSLINNKNISPISKSNTLLIGWNSNIQNIIHELDNYVLAGSELTILANKKESKLNLAQIIASTKNVKVTFIAGDATDPVILEKIGLEKFGHIILLCYDDMEIQDSDALTLVTLIHLREFGQILNAKFNIVSEMLDIRNKALAQLAKPDDFVVSDNITSLVLTQICENRDLLDVFTELFDAEGCEIYLKPASDYITLNKEINFYTVIQAALEKNEIAIGYRKNKQSNDPGKNYGVVNNPIKSEYITYEEEDKIIIISA